MPSQEEAVVLKGKKEKHKTRVTSFEQIIQHQNTTMASKKNMRMTVLLQKPE